VIVTLDQFEPLAGVATQAIVRLGFAWLVLGVRGDACYSLQVPAWAATGDPSDASSIEVIVEVGH